MDTKPMDIVDRLTWDLSHDEDAGEITIQGAITEIERLRAENAELHSRVGKLQQALDLINMIQKGATSSAYNPAWQETWPLR